MAETKTNNAMQWVLLIVALILIGVGVLLLEGSPIGGIVCIVIGAIILMLLAVPRFRKAEQKQE